MKIKREFLSPTIDIAFKKLFGSQERKELTISFLNSVLERKEGELITHVQINDNANIPETFDKKVSFVDVNCTDQSGKRYIIEVQVVNERNFIERSQYYTSFFLSRQLEPRAPYQKLVPVIFVGVVCFDLFDHTNYLSHHLIMDNKTCEQTMDLLEFHYIELSKFHKTLDELTADVDKWIYFLKEADRLDEIPRQLQSIEEMVEAFSILERARWTEGEFMEYMVEVDKWRRTEGAYQALFEIGREEGRAEGLIEAKIEVARTMLMNSIDDQMIAKLTGLSIETILNIKNK